MLYDSISYWALVPHLSSCMWFWVSLSHFPGEHIDYCGYSVLPMAIEQNILAAVSVNRSGTITLVNTNPQYRWELVLDNVTSDVVMNLFIFWQGFHIVLFGGNRHRQRESKMALLFSVWTEGYPGKRVTLYIREYPVSTVSVPDVFISL